MQQVIVLPSKCFVLFLTFFKLFFCVFVSSKKSSNRVVGCGNFLKFHISFQPCVNKLLKRNKHTHTHTTVFKVVVVKYVQLFDIVWQKLFGNKRGWEPRKRTPACLVLLLLTCCCSASSREPNIASGCWNWEMRHVQASSWLFVGSP